MFKNSPLVGCLASTAMKLIYGVSAVIVCNEVVYYVRRLVSVAIEPTGSDVDQAVQMKGGETPENMPLRLVCQAGLGACLGLSVVHGLRAAGIIKQPLRADDPAAPINKIVAAIQVFRGSCGNMINRVAKVLKYGSLAGSAIVLLLVLYHMRSMVRLGYGAAIRCWWGGGSTRAVLSVLIDALATRPATAPDTIRVNFTDLPEVEPQVKTNHTHPKAAASRSAASSFIEFVAVTLGRRAWFYQMSKSDQRVGRQGCREYYWAKDTGAKATLGVPEANDIMALVDVDYYVDMNEFLTRQMQPIMMYTLQPKHVAKVTEEYSYTFDKDNKCVYKVTGGGSYTHQLWNYSPDYLVAVRSWFGYPVAVSHYNVDRRVMGSDHELVMLTPVASWTGFAALIARILGGTMLQRYKVVCGDHLRLEVHGRESVYRSTATVGSYAVGEVQISIDDAIACMARLSKYDLGVPQVISIAGCERVEALPLVEYHRKGQAYDFSVIHPVDTLVRRYQYSPKTYDPEVKAGMVSFMQPFIPAAFVADLCKSSEERCVQGRILDVRSPELKANPFLIRCMSEFVKRFIPKEHVGCPVDEDEVYIRQGRPAQRVILEQAQFLEPLREAKMFIKKEAYAQPKDPRPITTYNGTDKAAYSRYIYALSDHLKELSWYAFGRTPFQVAVRVADLCSTALDVTNSDFSRYDGTISNLLRYLEKMVILRYFHPRYHEEAFDLFRSSHGIRVRGTYGTSYDLQYARGSGSPETATFNSIDNAFVSFYAIAMMLHGDFDTAWQRLGVYGGDDGLTADIDPDKYMKAAKALGLRLEISTVRRNSHGIKFLARNYSIDVWNGDPSSTCDVIRQLSKFHVTTKLPLNISSVDKMIEKCRSFILSDSNTVVIGPFCRRCLHFAKIEGWVRDSVKMQAMRMWIFGEGMSPTDQYPNSRNHMDVHHVSAVVEHFDVNKFTKWLESTTCLADLLVMPVFCDVPQAKPSAEHAMVVDGEIFDIPKVAASGARSQKKMRNRVNGRNGPQVGPDDKRQGDSSSPFRPNHQPKEPGGARGRRRVGANKQ